MAEDRQADRRSIAKACDRCKVRKIRCALDAGFASCNSCRTLGAECHFSQKKKPRRRTQLEVETERRRQAVNASSASCTDSTPLQYVQPVSRTTLPATVMTPSPSVPLSNSSNLGDTPRSEKTAYSNLHGDPFNCSNQASPLPYDHEKIPKLYIDRLLGNPMASTRAQNEQIQSQPRPDLVGTNLSLAFLSKKRTLALSQRLGHNRLSLLVERIESILKSRMMSIDKLPHPSVVREKLKEAPFSVGEEASTYIRTYFDQVHPLYPFLDRPAFEERLVSPELAQSLATDKAWCALYHAVLAIGCQYHGGGSFEPGKGQAWKFFELSSSLCPDLVVLPACLMTVQALTAMAVFARNVSCIQLESIIISQAARLAQARGYNRSTATTETAIQRTFWVLYCMEKTTCFYTGNTSILNDLDIGCPPPNLPEPSFQGFDWLLAFSRYGRLVSQIYDNLFAINATGKSSIEYYDIIDELSANLERWRLSIPDPFRPGAEFRIRAFRGPPALTLAIFIHYLYYSVLMALSRATLHVAVTNSSHCVRHEENKRLLMRTARSVLELTKWIEVESYTPVWVLAFMPISALFILFDFVVHNPAHPETNSNLALLDIAGGHFSYLEYVCHGSLPGSLVAEFAHMARQYVQDFRLQQCQTNSGHHALPLVASTTVATANPETTATPIASGGYPIQSSEGPQATQQPQPGQIEQLQTNEHLQEFIYDSTFEGTDPLIFSLGPDSTYTPAESGSGVDIMDLFDLDLSSFWSTQP